MKTSAHTEAQTAQEIAGIMTANVCGLCQSSCKVSVEKPETNFRTSQGVVLCLREFLPESEDEDGTSHDICLLGPEGLKQLLVIPYDREKPTIGRDIWKDLLDACLRHGCEIRNWSPADIPGGTLAVRVVTASRWPPPKNS